MGGALNLTKVYFWQLKRVTESAAGGAVHSRCSFIFESACHLMKQGDWCKMILGAPDKTEEVEMDGWLVVRHGGWVLTNIRGCYHNLWVGSYDRFREVPALD